MCNGAKVFFPQPVCLHYLFEMPHQSNSEDSSSCGEKKARFSFPFHKHKLFFNYLQNWIMMSYSPAMRHIAIQHYETSFISVSQIYEEEDWYANRIACIVA